MKKSSRAPIGVFDSGLGGLTVFKVLARRMPEESLIYFGDTAHVPYGSKSPEAIARYSTMIAIFLAKRGIKLLVVACNTSSAWALPAIRKAVKVPVIGVIEPGARGAVGASRGGRIGVIGTEAMVNSGAYERAIKALKKNALTASAACPLFVPLVEEGWLETEATNLIAQEYLAPFAAGKVDTLVLGCTHYPLLKRAIGDVVGREVRLIDSAEETAAETVATLRDRGLTHEGEGTVRHRFISSDVPDQFLRVGQRFLGTPLDLVETITLG
jgi:glutamate racemase